MQTQTTRPQGLTPEAIAAHATYREALIRERHAMGRTPYQIVQEFTDVSPRDIYAILGLRWQLD